MASRRLPMFPLGAVLFPHAVIPLHVFEPRYRALMRHCLDADRRFGVVLIERGSEVGGGDERAHVGTQGVIRRAAELPDGRWVLEVVGEVPVVIEEWLPDDPYPVALVSDHPGDDQGGVDGGEAEAELEALCVQTAQRIRRTRAVLSEHGGTTALPPGLQLDGGGNIEAASWQLCAAAPLSTYDAQKLLIAGSTAARLVQLTQFIEELELDLERMLTAE